MERLTFDGLFCDIANCKACIRRTDYPAAEPFSEQEDQKAVNLWNRRV